MEDQEYIETHPVVYKEPTYELEKKRAICKNGIPFIPKKGRIIVLQNEFVQRSVIYVPDISKVKPTTGRVVAIGPDVEEGFVELDEPVVFNMYGGVPISIVDKEGKVSTFLSLTQDEIVGTLITEEKND